MPKITPVDINENLNHALVKITNRLKVLQPSRTFLDRCFSCLASVDTMEDVNPIELLKDAAVELKWYLAGKQDLSGHTMTLKELESKIGDIIKRFPDNAMDLDVMLLSSISQDIKKELGSADKRVDPDSIILRFQK